MTAPPEPFSGTPSIDVRSLYRMPWKMSDNAMAWLEPTRKCNITCDACFAVNDPLSQKSLARIESELDTLLRLRRCDAVLIAGGEPLTHPDIVEVVRMVRKKKVKPHIVTNGVELHKGLLHDLHANGAYGITFHVDSHQARPGWKNKTEMDLNELRQEFADMVALEGGMVCGFNTTIFPDTLYAIPDIIGWTTRNIRRVNVMTLIAARMLSPGIPFDFYASGKKVNLSEMGFFSEHEYANLTTEQMFREVKKELPDFKFCGFVGGTTLPLSLKWGIACRIGSERMSYGNLGPKSMELMQNAYHAWNGCFLAFAKPGLSRKARLLFLFGLFDKEIRTTAGNYLRSVLHDPRLFFETLSVQSISLLQPLDILPNGEQDNCDACPNATVWNDRLVPACQLDTFVRFGGPVIMMPKQ